MLIGIGFVMFAVADKSIDAKAEKVSEICLIEEKMPLTLASTGVASIVGVTHLGVVSIPLSTL